MGTIQDIADQTNLLALNAAIEAARAGEQGRGFAVVADEVRKLAEKAGASSREIADLVRAVQKGTEEAVRATEVGADNVARGVEGARGAGQALQEILAAAEQNSQATANIQAAAARVQELAVQVAAALRSVASVGEKNLAATKQMSGSIGEIASSVESVAATAEENSASVQEVSATAEELAAQVDEVSSAAQKLAQEAVSLRAAAGLFRTDAASGGAGIAAEFEAFRRAHLNWVKRGKEMIDSGVALAESELVDFTRCALGQWFDGIGKAQWGTLPEYRAVADPHRHVHESARAIAAAVRRGDRGSAEAAYRALVGASQGVLETLDALKEQAQAAHGQVGGRAGRPAAPVTANVKARLVALAGR